MRKPKALPKASCPFCRKPVDVMPSGLFAMHPVKGKWKASMCRGSGKPVVAK